MVEYAYCVVADLLSTCSAKQKISIGCGHLASGETSVDLLLSIQKNSVSSNMNLYRLDNNMPLISSQMCSWHVTP